jgi:hypothetical protein
VSQKSGTNGKGGEARRRGGRNRIEGVGEVRGSPMRLSTTARIERGGAAVRGRRGCRGRTWKGRRGAPVQGGALGGDGQAKGGQKRWRLVDRGVVVGVATACGEAEVGREQKKRTKMGSSSAGRSPYSCTRRWPSWQKRWVAR